MIGTRLKLARQASGLSLRELSLAIGNRVTAQAIGKYEHDEMVPGSDVLIALAGALHVSEEFLLSPAEIELVDVEFRKEMTTERQEAKLEATVLSEVERYLEIEDILASPSSSWDLPEGFPYPIRVNEDAESAAKKLRKQWDLGSDPIPNLVEFLEERGIKVVCMTLPTEISGMMCWVKRKDGNRIPVIALNDDHDGERQRFSLAHELGHLVLVIPEEFDEKDKESACHRFAGAFLIPLDALVAKVGRHRRALRLEELFALKGVFGVSAQAIAYRCKDTNIISKEECSRIFKSIVARGWRKQEPMQLAKERPTRFGRMCLRALAENCISESKAAELLRVPVRALHARLNQAAGITIQ